MTLPRHKFCKAERINSKIKIDRLFSGGSKSLLAFPVRAVYTTTNREPDSTLPPVSILVSVSKRHFKHAVKRNRVKRQIREAYRLNKEILWQALEGQPVTLNIAFIWLSDTLVPSSVVEKKIINILQRIAEKQQPKPDNDETAQ